MGLFARSLTATLVLAASHLPAHAAVTMSGEEEIIVQSHEVIDDDLIVWGSYVRIDGLVKGDLVVFGTEVVVEGIIEEDLIAVGQTVYLNGQVGDDARIGAYALALGDAARVGDDLFDLSYSLEARPTSAVGGTLHAAARQALLAGQVVEDLLVRAGSLELRGLTGRDVRAVVGGLEGLTHSEFVIDLALDIPEVPEGVTLGPGTAVGGDVLYRSAAPALVDPSAQIAGEIRHEDWQTSPSGPIELPSLDEEESLLEEMAERLAALLLIGLLLAVSVPGWLRARGQVVRDGAAGMLGWGIGALVFGGIASFVVGVAGFTLLAVGIGTGSGDTAISAIAAGSLLQMALFALFGIALFYLGPVLASAGLGVAALERVRPGSQDQSGTVVDAMLLIALGTVLYAVLRTIPVVGWLFGLCGALIGLGVLTSWLREVFIAPPHPETRPGA